MVSRKLTEASTVSHRYAEQGSSPATPASGFASLYTLTGGELTLKDDTGKQTTIAPYWAGEEVITDFLKLGTGSELTIASGAVTMTSAYHVIDTEADAATDDLDTINDIFVGYIAIIRPANDARTIVVKNGTGNITTSTGSDITLDSAAKAVLLQRVGISTLYAHELGAGAGSASASGGIDITVTAGETLAERDAVFISSGTALKIDTDAATPLVGSIRGIVTQSGGIASAATGTVRVAGEVTGFTGLTAWSDVYASTTAGGVTQTKPSPTDGGGQVASVPLGYAVSTTAINVKQSPVQYLKRDTLADAATATIVHHSDPQGRTRRVSAYVATTANAIVTSYASANQDSDVALRLSAAGGSASASTAATAYVVGGFIATPVWQAQSFQVAAGNLSQITFNLGATSGSPTDTMTWEIRNDNAGTPGATVLDSGTISPTASATNTISGIAGPFLSAATTYWLILRPTTPQSSGNHWTVWGSDTDIYADGTRQSSSDGGASYSGSGTDLAFSVTTAAVSAKDKLSQSFQLSGAATIDKARLWLKKTGTPTGTMTLRIETDTAGSPSGTLANANATVTLAESGLTTSYAWYEFDFATNFSLSGSTSYWLVLSTDRTASATNYVEWGADGSTPSYADGEMKSEVSSVWGAESKDAVFEVLQEVTAYDEPVVVGRSSGGTRDVGVRFDNGAGVDANTKTTFSNVSGSTLDLTCIVELE